MQLGILDYVIVAATADFLENRAKVPRDIAQIDAAIDLLFENHIVFDRGVPRPMTEEELAAEKLV